MTGSSPSPRGLSLRAKATLLLLVVAILPAAAIALRLLAINRVAVETAEQKLQSSVLAEVAASVETHVHETEADAQAVAHALSLAAADADGVDLLAAVRSLLATRRNIDAVRFEVPDSGVNTVLRRHDAAGEVPASTPALRRQADSRGVAFAAVPAGRGVVVVPIAPVRAGAPRGYVTVAVDFATSALLLEELRATRFDGGDVNLLVVDAERRVVAFRGHGTLPAGSDADHLPIWTVLPENTRFSQRVGVISRHEADGTTMIGGVQTVPGLGWAVALWRPQASAYRTLAEMRRQSLFAAGITLLLAASLGFFAGRSVVAPVVALAEQAKRIGQRRWRDLEPLPPRRDELGTLARTMTVMAADLATSEQELARETRLRHDLGRFMGSELVDAIVRGEHAIELGGHRAEISVLFADVVAFTPFAEERPPEEAVALLNELFSVLSEVVFRHGGVVDKFIGDCLMAVWGAPTHQPDHAARAVAAAEEMIQFVETAREDWAHRFGTTLEIAIGINSGEAIVGNIGSAKRMEYTVVGDTVNIAARLEGIARPNQVLIAERTRVLIGDAFALTELGSHELSGRTAATRIFQLELGDVTG